MKEMRPSVLWDRVIGSQSPQDSVHTRPVQSAGGGIKIS